MKSHVLYVDDDIANLIVFEAVCADFCPVLMATTVQEAWELMKTHRIGVVITDQRMPGQTGIEFLERTRIDHPDTIRLLVTAYADLQAAIDAINRGHVRRYLRKPWEPEELRAEVCDALELYELSRRVRSLEHRVRETERVYALGVVAASVTHEIRNPIGWVVNNVQVMRLQLEHLRAEMARPEVRREKAIVEIDHMAEALDDAAAGAQRVVEVVRSVELSSRPNSREDDLVDIGEAVKWTIRLVRGVAQHDFRLEVQEGEWPTIRGSSHKVCQVLLNLLVNAVHAVKDVEPSKRWVGLRHRGDETWVEVEVEDGGPGIPSEIGDKVFDPFFTTKDGEGSGLGLAISRNIAREMGGDLTLLDTEKTRGALFRLRVPMVRPIV
jgi:signal transduction histidine kinase